MHDKHTFMYMRASSSLPSLAASGRRSLHVAPTDILWPDVLTVQRSKGMDTKLTKPCACLQQGLSGSGTNGLQILAVDTGPQRARRGHAGNGHGSTRAELGNACGSVINTCKQYVARRCKHRHLVIRLAALAPELAYNGQINRHGLGFFRHSQVTISHMSCKTDP